MSWKNNSGQDHIFILKDCRHFPDSPVNIISVSQFGLHFNHSDEGTYIKSGTSTSALVWDHAKFTCTITHTSGYMPCLVINDRTSVFATFVDQFSICYDEDLSIALLTNAQTVTLQYLESTNKLFGTPTIYTDTDDKTHHGLIVGQDGESYTVSLSSGTEITVPTTSLPLDKDLHPQSSTPIQISDHIRHHGKVSGDSLPLHKANQPLDNDQHELLRWHV